jgi:hypothetical protein
VDPASASSPPPQLELLRVLVEEGGADADEPDSQGCPPSHWLIELPPGPQLIAAIDALTSLGADLNRRCHSQGAAILPFAWRADAEALRRFLRHGATVDLADPEGETPLSSACFSRNREGRRESVELLLRHSSAATRRRVRRDGGQLFSAADSLVIRVIAEAGGPPNFEPWHLRVIGELLRSGAPLLPVHAARLCRPAARLGDRREAEGARRARSAGTTWQEHERFVKLAFDVRDAREADEALAATQRRVQE